MKKLLLHKSWLLAVLLSIALVGTLVLVFIMSQQLSSYETRYELQDQALVCKEHENTITALQSENQKLTSKLKTANETSFDHALAAAKTKLSDKYQVTNKDYTSQLSISDMYYKRNSDKEISVLAFAEIEIQSKKYGTAKQTNAYIITIKYDDDTWTVKSITQADGYRLEDFLKR